MLLINNSQAEIVYLPNEFALNNLKKTLPSDPSVTIDFGNETIEFSKAHNDLDNLLRTITPRSKFELVVLVYERYLEEHPHDKTITEILAKSLREYLNEKGVIDSRIRTFGIIITNPDTPDPTSHVPQRWAEIYLRILQNQY